MQAFKVFVWRSGHIVPVAGLLYQQQRIVIIFSWPLKLFKTEQQKMFFFPFYYRSDPEISQRV